MTQVAQHLWFEKDMEEAVRFYTSLVPGSAVEWIDNPAGRHAEWAGRQRQARGLPARRPAL